MHNSNKSYPRSAPCKTPDDIEHSLVSVQYDTLFLVGKEKINPSNCLFVDIVVL